MKSIIFLWVALVCQSDREFNSREPVNRDGEEAAVAIPVEMHQQNTGGSDGQGLCVIASVKMVAEYLGQAAAGEALWEEAKRRPGGYYPEKFDQLAKDVAPDLKYAHYVGSDYQVLVNLTNEGIPFGITMDTGELYNYQSIRHMVAGNAFGKKNAVFVDNNRPGWFGWTTKEEWMRRATMNDGKFWVLALAPSDEPGPATMIGGIIFALIGFFLMNPQRKVRHARFAQ